MPDHDPAAAAERLRRDEEYWKERRRISEQDYSRDELEHYLATDIIREQRAESVSDNTNALIDLLRQRDAKGLVKYGVSLDRDDLTQEQWIQHAIEELLDAAAYLHGLKRGFEKVRAALPLTAAPRQEQQQ